MPIQPPKRLLPQLISHLARSPRGRPPFHLRQHSFPSPRCIHSTTPRLAARSQPGSSTPREAPRGTKQDKSRSDTTTKTNSRLTLLAASGGLLASLFAILPPDDKPAAATAPATTAHPQPPQPAHPSSPLRDNDTRDPSLPRFRLADIRAHHGAASPRPWVTSADKVYDITDWVAAHPGGDVILRAAGASIDPYWDIFAVHKAPYVRDILDSYLVGLVDAADLDTAGRPRQDEQVADPFAADPPRDARLLTLTEKPRNAEPPPAELARDFLTPNELFYVRNHMWVPIVDADVDADPDDESAPGGGFALTVELPDGDTRRYSMRDLRARFRHHRVTAAMQCSGNRRSDMTRAVGSTNGLQWGPGAISNAEWEGVRLADVLADAGLDVRAAAEDAMASTAVDDATDTDRKPAPAAAAMHVHLAGLEAYSASIPLATALDPRADVLLAWGMNGATLPRDHGYPLRAVVPGHVAARSVKWLSRIAVADEESDSQWQRRDYKCFGPNEGAKPDWDRYPAMLELPVTSAVTSVQVVGGGEEDVAVDESKSRRAPVGARDPRAWAEQPAVKDKLARAPVVELAGYAYSGGGRKIVRVDVSVDGGQTWDQARLLDGGDDGESRSYGNKAWAWRRWRHAGRLLLPDEDEDEGQSGSGRRCAEVVVKATDDAYGSQPDAQAGVYNVRGNLANGWHRVRVCPRRRRCCGGGGAGGKRRGGWETGDVYGSGFQMEEEGGEEEEKGNGKEK